MTFLPHAIGVHRKEPGGCTENWKGDDHRSPGYLWNEADFNILTDIELKSCWIWHVSQALEVQANLPN